MNWYPAFAIAVLVLWAFSSTRDRTALRIILIATLGSFLLTEGITRHIIGAWKLVVPATVETATILSLLRWTPNRTGYMQAASLIVAWLAHILCYVDVVTGSNMVYDRYSNFLLVVALLQLSAFHDTISHNLRRLVAFWDSFRPWRILAIHCAGLRHSLLPDPRTPNRH